MVNLISKKEKEARFEAKESPQKQADFKAEDGEEIEIGTDKKVKLNRYHDLEGVSINKLSIGYWFVKNKRNFISLLIGFLFVIIAVTFGVYAYTFGKYIFKGMKQDRASLEFLSRDNLISFNNLARKGALDIVNYTPVVVKTGAKYDFIVKIENPNPYHFAHFDFSFQASAGTVGRNSGFVLPSESKYIMSLGVESLSNISAATLNIDKINWQRVNKKKILDWSLFEADRLNIYIDEKEFIPGQNSKLSENIILNRLHFTAHNNTAYNYYDAGFNIILIDNNREAAAYRHQIDRFMSGEDYYVDLTLPYNIGNVDKIIIQPEIDITKDDIYIDIGEKYGF